MFDCADFESERPLIFTLEEIEEATNDFDESKKIGEGGYGKVYFGVLGVQVAHFFDPYACHILTNRVFSSAVLIESYDSMHKCRIFFFRRWL